MNKTGIKNIIKALKSNEGSFMNYLEEIIANISGDRVYIQTHNFPDPDAIACAYGLFELLKAKGVEAEICYKGSIERTVTAKMVGLLGIEVKEYMNPDEFNEEDEIILVDAQKGNSNIIDMNGQEIICIDHHPIYDPVDYRFSDIRPDVGACASIIATYYFDNNIDMSENVATALLYGIKMDTADMKRGVTQLDLDMFYKLYMMADRDILSDLDSSVLHYDDIKAYKDAFSTIDIREDVCFACAGYECKEALIAAICDFTLTLDGINLSIVYSPKQDGIKISIRSSRKYLSGVIAMNALKGIGTGGGHDNMAGGYVSYWKPDGEKISEAEILRIEQEIKTRFLKEAGIE